MRTAAYMIFLITGIILSVSGAIAQQVESSRKIAIALDDAPLGERAMGEWDRAGALIKSLDDTDVQAAFFVTTRGFDGVPQGRERVLRYAAAGHVLANHTHTHPWLSRTTTTDYLADIDEAAVRLEGMPSLRPWFRYPFLDKSRQDVEKRDAVRLGLKDRGLFDAYVTADTYDWYLDDLWRQAVRDDRPVDLIALERVYAAMVLDAAEHGYGLADDWLEDQPVHVLLLHENDAAALFLPAAINALRTAGWTIVTPDEAYTAPLPEPVTLFSGMGRVASLARDAGAEGPEVFDHWSASREGIDARVVTEGAIQLAD